MDDQRLLRQFVEHNSQEAFAALTKRYLSLVYSVCRRELDDTDAAEDVTQAVFLILARKAPALRRNVVLSGWLFQTARFAAKNARLQAQRRAAYEQKVAEAMEPQSQREDPTWTEIEPILNQSLAALGEGERDCILLRFFQGLSFAEAGAALGLSEEAARKRVTRALEKMRRFFGKQGVIVPSAALAVLLSAHAAKAVSTACQANVAAVTTGVLAGHLPLGLAGSHVYQLSEGALKAMKIAQIKLAVGLAATAAIGLTTYTVAKGVTLPLTKAHQVAPMMDVPKPGHLLAQDPGKTLSAAQIAARSREAYAALESYQVTTKVTSQAVMGDDPTVHEYHTTAAIQFVRPGKLRADGTDMSGNPFALVSDGVATAQTQIGDTRAWRKADSAEMAIASVTGTAQSAATTIPAVLLGTNWANPLPKGRQFDAEVREDPLDGQACYVLTATTGGATNAGTQSLWIDEKTFLLRRSLSDNATVVQVPPIVGPAHSVAVKSHDDERFTNERLNEAIPESTFTVPAAE